MAAPQITSMTVTPSVVAPGGTVRVVVIAHDPDSQVVYVQSRVRDASGNMGMSEEYPVQISDPLTYEVLVPAGFLVTPVAGQPGVFDVTVPA